MLISRRQWLSITAGSVYATSAFPCRVVAQSEAAGPVDRRISRIIREYEQQGFHRTGTAVDQLSGDWLCEEVHQAGLAPAREAFSLSRVDLVTNVLVADGRRIEDVPLFDGAHAVAAERLQGARTTTNKQKPANTDAGVAQRRQHD